MSQQIMWKPVNHPDILPGYLISPEGYIKAEGMKNKDAIIEPSYHSTNGYDFMLLNNKDGNLQLFPLDDIIALAYIPIPSSLKDKPIKVLHINGDTRDISLDNLQWVEDIEEWRVCTYPGVKPDMYEVSSWGRIRNIQTGNLIHGCITRGYLSIDIMVSDNLCKLFLKHRLLAWEFLERTNNFIGSHINHIDGVGLNNKTKNIEIVSAKQNAYHATFTGLTPHLKGEKCPMASLSNDTVEKICLIIVSHKGVIKDIMSNLHDENINISISVLNNILYKRSWIEISDRYFKKNEFHQHLTEENVIEICKILIETDFNVKDTVRIFNETHDITLTKRNAYKILEKVRWKHVADRYF